MRWFIDIHKFIVKILTHPESDLKNLARNEFKRWKVLRILFALCYLFFENIFFFLYTQQKLFRMEVLKTYFKISSYEFLHIGDN